MEGNCKLLEQTARSLEQALGLLGLPASCSEVRAEAGNVRVQELRAQSRRKPLDDREQLVRLVEPVQLERRLHREGERLLDGVERDPHRVAFREHGLSDS